MSTTTILTKSLLLATGVAIVLSPIAGFAKGEGRGQGPRIEFEALDTNQDGALTVEEMIAHASLRFSQADVDGDGFLSKEEVSANEGDRRAKRADRMFERRDANDDGKLSAEEMAPSADRVAKRFERADADEDGSLSKAEFEEAGKKRRGGHQRASK